MKLNEKDYTYRLYNLKRDCLYRFFMIVLIGALLGFLMSRRSKEFPYFFISLGFFTILGIIITICRYIKGKKKIDHPNIIEEEEDTNND